MIAILSRLIVRLATAWLRDRRPDWADAMAREADVAIAHGAGLSFAAGCLVTAARDALASAQGRFVVTNYAFAIGLLLPMAAVQIGCALFDLPYLYPGGRGLPGAVMEGAVHEPLLRGIYQAAVPSLAVTQLVAGAGHVRLAWALLERDWSGAVRWGLRTLAAASTLVVFMIVLFLDTTQALVQGGVLVIELIILALVMRRHAEIFAVADD